MATMAPPGGGRGGTQSTSVQSDDLPNRGFIAELSPALTAELIEGAPSVYYPEGKHHLLQRQRNHGCSGGFWASALLHGWSRRAGADGQVRWPWGHGRHAYQ